VGIRTWLTHAQAFVALEVVVYLSQFFVQLRNMALFLALAPLLMLFAVSSYPFQPQRMWLLLAAGLVGIVTVVLVRIVIQMERDELLSRISGTTPDQLNFHWPFFSRVLLYAVPLLGVLVASSSNVSDLIHAWLDPLLQMLK
jgi:hypothetical protein